MGFAPWTCRIIANRSTFASKTCRHEAVLCMGSSNVHFLEAVRSANEWQHFIFMRTGTTLTVYRNGVNAGSVAESSGLNTYILGEIGGDVTAGENWNGLIDDVRIYNRA